MTPEQSRLLAAQRAQLDKIAAGADRRLYQLWVRAWDDIHDDLEAALRAAAAGQVSGAVRARRARQALEIVAAQMFATAQRVGTDICSDADAMIDLAQAHTTAVIGAQLAGAANVAGLVVRADQAQIVAIARRVQRQITARTFILQDDATAAVRSELVRGVAEGIGPLRQAAAMLSAVQGAFNGGLTRARTIARTETIDAYRSAAMATEKANADVLAGWLWLADLGQRTCMSCVAQHGTFHKLDEPGPEDHPNGRCTRYPVTKSWKQLGFNGIADLPRPAITGDGAKWLKRQPEAVQRHILGTRGQAAWKAGQFPPSAWSVRRDNPGWRGSWGAGKPPSGPPPK